MIIGNMQKKKYKSIHSIAAATCLTAPWVSQNSTPLCVLPRLQGVGDSWRILPVKRRLLSTVKRILQLLDKVSLPRQPKKAFFFQPPLPDKIHTLLHQHRSQAVPISLFVSDSVF